MMTPEAASALERRLSHFVVYRAMSAGLLGPVRAVLRALARTDDVPYSFVRPYAKMLETLLHGDRSLAEWIAFGVVDSENDFTRAAEKYGANLPGVLREQARLELGLLEEARHLDLGALYAACLAREPDISYFVSAADFIGLPDRIPLPDFAEQLLSTPNWPSQVEQLVLAVHRRGAGEMGRYRAFRWTGERFIRGNAHVAWDLGRLEGIADPDPIRLTDLVGYERERAEVVRNTERFLAGLPAHNVLLVGERGTGKSSTVKALMNEYADQGLRLVEMARDQLSDLSGVLQVLRRRPQKFILFLDDLSFEDHETEYKPLKAVLEGSVAPRPANVLLYATSNRRHLVRERFSDRAQDPDDVRRRDTVEEKLSLADRFGLHALFLSPDQERYVAIAIALARANGITLPDADLRARAIRWAEWHNGRSPRTARQFVDDLIGSQETT